MVLVIFLSLLFFTFKLLYYKMACLMSVAAFKLNTPPFPPIKQNKKGYIYLHMYTNNNK